MPCESQRTVTIIFPVDGIVFALFGARSPLFDPKLTDVKVLAKEHKCIGESNHSLKH